MNEQVNPKYAGKIKFYQEKMEDLPYENEFDLAIILGNNLLLIPDKKAVRTIQNMSRALKPGGKLFLELDNRSYYLKNEANTRDWNLFGKRFLLCLFPSYLIK